MRTPYPFALLVTVMLVTLLLAAAACSGTDEGLNEGSCAPGEALQCTCGSSTGFSTCLPSGLKGPCDCSSDAKFGGRNSDGVGSGDAGAADATAGETTGTDDTAAADTTTLDTGSVADTGLVDTGADDDVATADTNPAVDTNTGTDTTTATDTATSPDTAVAPDTGATADTNDQAPPSIACKDNGVKLCGGHGNKGGAKTLYRCKGGLLLYRETCKSECVWMPPGLDDRCTGGLKVPASLVTVLDVKPYVEGSCQSATYSGWPHKAKKCSYSAGGISTTVTVANPSPAVVAAWIVDAMQLVKRLAALEGTSQAHYEQGLAAMAKAVLYQSSRIFPLSGGILENMGSGWVNYPFEKGVTQGCSSGCYCRINSLHRTEYCAYRAFLKAETYSACMARVGSSGLTQAWGDQCLGNHKKAWTRDYNEHFRAKAYKADKVVKAKCPKSTSCSPAQVLAAVKSALGV